MNGFIKWRLSLIDKEGFVLETFVWVLQGLLAVAFFMAGLEKVTGSEMHKKRSIISDFHSGSIL